MEETECNVRGGEEMASRDVEGHGEMKRYKSGNRVHQRVAGRGFPLKHGTFCRILPVDTAS